MDGHLNIKFQESYPLNIQSRQKHNVRLKSSTLTDMKITVFLDVGCRAFDEIGVKATEKPLCQTIPSYVPRHTAYKTFLCFVL